jgi:ADP-ribose pyrophosphatase YjhB (NUDIX family)
MTIGLATALRLFILDHPEDSDLAGRYAALAEDNANPWLRTRLAGHFTGSAFVVSRDGQRTLLLHHAKLDRWLQPGGHADGDHDLARVAWREASEETGLHGLLVCDRILDLDCHVIPARPNEPEHLHWDVRFVVQCTSDEQVRISSESRAARWLDIAQLAADPSQDISLRRLAERFMARPLAAWLAATPGCP